MANNKLTKADNQQKKSYQFQPVPKIAREID